MHNEGQNAVGGGDTEERAPNTTDMNNTIMLEDNSNANPPAEASVQESSPVTQHNATNDVGVVDIIHQCKWYNYDNVDHIPLNVKVPKKVGYSVTQ